MLLLHYKNAEFVVSTSFHGVAFSIIFKKQFYVLGMRNNSERVKTLLSTFDIGDRYLSNIEDADYSVNIDYEKIEYHIEEKINNSKKMILKRIEDICKQ